METDRRGERWYMYSPHEHFPTGEPAKGQFCSLLASERETEE